MDTIRLGERQESSIRGFGILYERWLRLLFFSILFFCRFLSSEVRASSVKQIDKSIKSHQESLQQLQKQIQELEAEEESLKAEEEKLTKALKKLDSNITQSVKSQARVRKKIHEKEVQIQGIMRQIATLSSENLKWEESLLDDLQIYYVNFVYPQRLRTNPMAHLAMQSLISWKYSHMKNAENQISFSIQKKNEMLQAKEKLVLLKTSSEEEIKKQKNSQFEKSQLYKTTMSKRALAEEQAKQLRETAESLEKLIAQLMRKKAKTLAEQREAELLKRTFEGKRGTLPWPVSGAVVSPYGKQIHPDLNIAVINNGIRIKAKPNSQVKTVEKGTVIYAANFRSYGQTVIIDHGGDTYSIYGLLGSIEVKNGARVKAGEILGVTTPEESSQLYFEWRVQGRTENPLLWLK